MKMIIALFAVSYVGLAILTYGGTISYFWNEFPNLQGRPNRLTELRNRGLFFAIFPLGPLVIPFLTNGYASGFKW